jgi:two-component system, NarL family, sensor histidine kinase UhpB
VKLSPGLRLPYHSPMDTASAPENLPPAGLRILHLEDSELDHQLVCRALRRDGLVFSIERTDALDEFAALTQDQRYDVILADYRLPGFTALDAWAVLQSREQRLPFILLSGAIGRALEVVQARNAEARAMQELAASEQRLAQFALHLQSAIENERAAIAREIHDDIGGSLAAVKLDLSWVARHVPPGETQEHVKAATDMLQHAIGASQRIMMNLRPAILDQGLYPAIQWLAESFQRRTGVRTSLVANNELLRAGKAVELTAYRTAQEALTNISKYAQCTEVRIDLSDAEEVLTLEVSDNGQGISDEQLQNPASFGIRGLRERARVVGGWLDISTQPGRGTTVILSVPLNHSGHSPTETDFQ